MRFFDTFSHFPTIVMLLIACMLSTTEESADHLGECQPSSSPSSNQSGEIPNNSIQSTESLKQAELIAVQSPMELKQLNISQKLTKSIASAGSANLLRRWVYNPKIDKRGDRLIACLLHIAREYARFHTIVLVRDDILSLYEKEARSDPFFLTHTLSTKLIRRLNTTSMVLSDTPYFRNYYTGNRGSSDTHQMSKREPYYTVGIVGFRVLD